MKNLRKMSDAICVFIISPILPNQQHCWPSETLPAVQAKLLEIHRATAGTREARKDSQVVLAINRSDYMLDEPSTTMMQVPRHYMMPVDTADQWCWRPDQTLSQLRDDIHSIAAQKEWI